MESVFSGYDRLIFRLGNNEVIKALTLTVFYKKFLALTDILFLELMPEPLIDLVLGGGGLGN